MRKFGFTALFLAVATMGSISYAGECLEHSWVKVGTTKGSLDSDVFGADTAKTKNGVSLAGESKIHNWNICSEEGFYYERYECSVCHKIAYEKFIHPATLHTDLDNDSKCDACEEKVYTAVVYHGTGSKNNVLTTINGDNLNLSGNDIAYVTGEDSELDTAPMRQIVNVVCNGKAIFAAFYNTESLYIPTSFTANYAGFAYTPTVYANENGGWNGLILPFDANEFYQGTSDFLEQVKVDHSLYVNGKTHVLTENNKEEGAFWVKELTISKKDSLGFSNLSNEFITKNTPYLIAVPGEEYGENSLEGKTIVFANRNTLISATKDSTIEHKTDEYTLYGTYTSQTLNDVYVLNTNNNNFTYSSETIVAPFTLYVKANTIGGGQRSLTIFDSTNDEDEEIITDSQILNANKFAIFSTNGEICIVASEAGEATIYDMNGAFVAKKSFSEGVTHITGIAKGSYIINGKVVVIK